MAHAISAMYPYIRAELPGIPEPLLVGAVKHTVSDFLSMSQVWKYTIPTLLDWTTALSFPAMDPATEIPAGTRVVRVDTVKYASDGASLSPVPFKTRQQLDEIYSNWEVKTGNTPLCWTNDMGSNGDAAIIVPIATANVLTSLKIRVVLSSIDALTTLPDFIMHEFEDVLQVGTLARLMKIPGKDWTNHALAAAYAAQYKAGWVKAKSRADAEFGQPNRETSYGGI